MIVISRCAAHLLVVVLAGGGSLEPSPAAAQQRREPAAGSEVSPEQEIRQLTASIKARKLDDEGRREALRRRGFLYATTGRGGLARQDLDALVRTDPADRDAHFFRGLSYFGIGAPMALESLSRAIELRPDAEAYAARGWVYLNLGKHNEAAQDFEEVLRLSPSDAEARRGRAWALVHLGAYDRALADLDALLGGSKARAEATALRGLAHYLAGRPSPAREDFRSAMRFRPVANGARTYYDLRIDDSRRHRTLLAVLEGRARRNPGDPELWLAAAAIGYRAYDDATPGSRSVFQIKATVQTALERVLALDPADVDALMMRAAFRSTPLFNYDPAGAIADLSEVIRLAPEQTEAYLRRAIIRATDKASLAQAVADCERAVALAPGDPQLRALLAKLKADRRAWEESMERAAAAKVQGERDREVMAVLFLAGLGALVATSEPHFPNWREIQERYMRDWAEDLMMERPCRTSTGRPC